MQDLLNEYLQELAETICKTLQEELNAIAIGGSIVFHDFHPDVSDIDVALFLNSPPSAKQLSILAQNLDHSVLPCPGKGLDLVAFLLQSVQITPPTPEAAFAFVTGKAWRSELTGSDANPDLLIDLHVIRNHGRSLFGPDPGDFIGSIGNAELRPLLVNVVQWHRDKIHDPFHDPMGEFAVLNACRAWRFLDTKIMGSKIEGGKWALARKADLTVISEALAIRQGSRTGPLPKTSVLHCMDAIEVEMTRAISSTQRS